MAAEVAAHHLSTENTYPFSLGQEPSVAAECLSLDPVADIAVFTAPDVCIPWPADDAPQTEWRAGELCQTAFEKLVDPRPTFEVGSIPADTTVPGFVRSLEGEWQKCTVSHRNGPLWLGDETGSKPLPSPTLDTATMEIRYPENPL